MDGFQRIELRKHRRAYPVSGVEENEFKAADQQPDGTQEKGRGGAIVCVEPVVDRVLLVAERLACVCARVGESLPHLAQLAVC